MKRLIWVSAIMSCSLAAVIAAEPAPPLDDEEAIRQAVAAYVEAFSKADAKALAALWTPEAVYVNPVHGESVVGREAIEQQFRQIFADAQGIKLEATTASIQFISPGVAVENGTAKLIQGEQPPEQSEYSAIYVKRDGRWLLDRVTEEVIIQPSSRYEQLKDLEWLVGRWTDEDDQSSVTTECHWSKNNNFLIRSFEIQLRDRIEMSGMQLIGWDPSIHQIRSWVFDSDGGFGQGTWTRKENRWYVQQSGILPDGRKTSAVNILTHLGDGQCTLQSVNRTVDGELLPNIDEVRITKE
jgi:uncharacterized protein (TIGR02246 family)